MLLLINAVHILFIANFYSDVRPTSKLYNVYLITSQDLTHSTYTKFAHGIQLSTRRKRNRAVHRNLQQPPGERQNNCRLRAERFGIIMSRSVVRQCLRTNNSLLIVFAFSATESRILV
jgi:hypothetical protein